MRRQTVAEALADAEITPAAPQPALTFDRTSVNGWRLANLPGIERMEDGGLRKRCRVQGPEGVARPCAVVLSPRLIAQILPHLAGAPAPGGDAFWEALCGEALANHLWQNADPPPGEILVVEELTRGLERWIAAVVEKATVA